MTGFLRFTYIAACRRGRSGILIAAFYCFRQRKVCRPLLYCDTLCPCDVLDGQGRRMMVKNFLLWQTEKRFTAASLCHSIGYCCVSCYFAAFLAFFASLAALSAK